MRKVVLRVLASLGLASYLFLVLKIQREYANYDNKNAAASIISGSTGMASLRKKRKKNDDRSKNNKKKTASAPEDVVENGGLVSSRERKSRRDAPPPLRLKKYAYAFVLGGVDPDIPKYRPYLYGVYVSSYNLRQFGSQADILLYVDVYSESSHTKLTPTEEDVLRNLGVTIRYNTRRANQTFYRLQLSKFRILRETKYRRILYLDADVMPMSNLDYLFEYSDPKSKNPPLLQPNLLVWGKFAPANGGTFMLEPHPGDIEMVQKMLTVKELKQLDGHKFNKTIGWGREIAWKSLAKSKTVAGWNFYAAQGDQGLLYHWAMHVQRHVSVLIEDGKIQTWGPPSAPSDSSKDDDIDDLAGGRVELKRTVDNPFSEIIPKPVHCWDMCDENTVFSNFVHFAGPNKPWKAGLPSNLKLNSSSETKFESPVHYWFYALNELGKKYNAKIGDLRRVRVSSSEKGHLVVAKYSGFQNYTGLTNLLD